MQNNKEDIVSNPNQLKTYLLLLCYGLLGYGLIAYVLTSSMPVQAAPSLSQAPAAGTAITKPEKSAAEKKAALRRNLLNNPEKIPHLLDKGKINKKDIPNPHWQKDACQSCHKGKGRAQRNNLRSKDKDMDKLCNNCHTSISEHSYIHVSNIKIPKAMHKRMPKSFKQAVKRGANKMTCITCHDLPMTCQSSRRKEKGPNPLFFRGGPYESRNGLCYHCHDQSKYKRVNAHKQISKTGKIQKEKCLLCHATDKNLTTAKTIEDVDFQVKDDLARLCWGCHRWKPHPGGSFTFFSGKGGTPNHLVKPSARIRDRMEEMQKKNNVLFPLEPGTGKVFCGTCHNPHERGVIKHAAAAKGADSNKRLRMQKICINCHDT